MVSSYLKVVAFYLNAFAVLTVLEILWRRNEIPIRDRMRGFMFWPVIGAVQLALDFALQPLKQPIINLNLTLPTLFLGAFAAVILGDLAFYWFHRLQHGPLWRFHKVHHSIEHLSAVNSYHHWTEPLFHSALVALPLALFSVSFYPFYGLLWMVLLWQPYYIHSPTKLNFGPFARILVDNRYHRIHHSVEPQHFDKNFAAVTPLWDWLFGTLYFPRRAEWPAVGLDDAREPRTYAEWHSMPWARPNPVTLSEGR